MRVAASDAESDDRWHPSPAALAAMFGRIAPRYDLVNTLLSLGLDRHWRRQVAAELRCLDDGLVLDVGTGTGELARTVAQMRPRCRVMGLDSSWSMLSRAPRKAQRKEVALRLRWLVGDALCLPFADGTFDAVVSAFVLRNVHDLDAAMGEMARVTRREGQVVALDFSPQAMRPWGHLIGLYLARMAPLLGAILAGNRSAYEYLPASVARFRTAEQVRATMEGAGLSPQPARRLCFGLVVIHRAVRP